MVVAADSAVRWCDAAVNTGDRRQGVALGLDGPLEAWFAGALPGAYAVRQIVSAVKVESHIPTALLLIPSILNLLVQIGNVGGWFWEPNFVAYLIGLFAYLYVAGLGFVYAVLFRPPS